MWASPTIPGSRGARSMSEQSSTGADPTDTIVNCREGDDGLELGVCCIVKGCVGCGLEMNE